MTVCKLSCLSDFAQECLFFAVVTKNFFAIDSEEDMKERSIIASLDHEGVVVDEPVGLVYVTAAPDQSTAGEANLGIVIADSHQRKGLAREAVDLVLRWAFEELHFHRVQAAIMDTPHKDRTMRLFVGQGFTHEGTRRRAVYKPENAGVAGTWKDVTYLAMLDTEWALKDLLRIRGPAPTLWDEMFARHTKEREEMARWDERHNRIRRVSSTDTLRNGTAPLRPDIIDPWPSDFESSSSSQSSVYGSVPPSPSRGAVDISPDMLRYLQLEENPMDDIDDVSRQSSPSPYSISFPPTPSTVPPRSPSLIPSISTSESEDEGEDEDGMSPPWRGLLGIPSTSASVRSRDQLSWTRRPLIPARGASGDRSSESESWSDAIDYPEDSQESDWDVMSEPESVSSR